MLIYKYENSPEISHNLSQFVLCAAAVHIYIPSPSHPFTHLLYQKLDKPWKRRWCVLTETEIIYFSSPDDAIPKGSVPLKSCKVHHLLGAENIFEIFSPELREAQKKKKYLFRSASDSDTMQFLAESTSQLYAWLFVLRSITGCIEPLSRRTPLLYSNVSVRELILNEVNESSETPLHILARSAIAAVTNSETTIASEDSEKLRVVAAAQW